MKMSFPLSTVLVIGLLQANAQAAGWSYHGDTGPDHWADLDKSNIACATGTQQSPIDIRPGDSRQAALPALSFHYKTGAAEVTNNGHTVQVNFPAGNHLSVGEQHAELLQFHFHAPSEERFDGKSYPMDAHLVHKTSDGKLSVVAVLFQEGKENPALKPVLDAMPKTGKKHTLKAFNPEALLPAERSYYRFAGSLTTPPCSEQVSWQVLKQPVELSQQQIAAFRTLYNMNARPVQPLNGRVVELSE